MMDEKRLLKPMIRRRGEWSEAGWDEALSFAATRLEAVARASGADSIAALASPKLTNEELYLLQKFVRVGLKTNNIGSFTNLVDGAERYALDDMFGLTVSTATMDDLEKADVIMVVNADPSEDNLIAELKIKAAVKKGARLVTVGVFGDPPRQILRPLDRLEARDQRGPHQRHLRGTSWRRARKTPPSSKRGPKGMRRSRPPSRPSIRGWSPK